MKVYLAIVESNSFMEGSSIEIAGVCSTKEHAWEILKEQSHFKDATNVGKKGRILDYYVYHFDGTLSYFFNVREVEMDKDLINTLEEV